MNSTTRQSWPISSTEGRWAGFGPYYAMFPVSFAKEVISNYSKPGDTVVDPFCGRGTTNYVSKILKRHSFGCDLNPVGWVYSKAKTDPCQRVGRLKNRVEEIWILARETDFEPKNEFQSWAWCPEVLGFLNSARRTLDWKHSKVDWTLASIILVYLHAKLGGGLSNQMRQSKSMAPDYSIAWWKCRSMNPPAIDPVKFLKSRIDWRYQKGLIKSDNTTIIRLGDARKVIPKSRSLNASLLLTSPPYMGVTDYQYDNWIRLWVLGGYSWPIYNAEQKYQNKSKYEQMIKDVFRLCRKNMKDDATVVVRTDRRKFTLETTVYVLNSLWPDHNLFARNFLVKGNTQTRLFGDRTKKPGEVDIILLPRNIRRPGGFTDLRTGISP